MTRSTALRASSLLLALSMGLGGCPDPTAGNSPGQGPGAPGGAPAGGPPGGGEAGAGGPPPAGGPGAGGAPMAGKNAGMGRPDEARFTVEEGEGVTLSGSFEYAGSATGQLRIDFLTVEGAGGPPKLAHALSLDEAGAWSQEAPKDFGDVYIVAFVDKKGDGPSADDPAGRIADAVKIGSENISGLKLVLSDDADLGDLAPGTGAPPAGSGEASAAISPQEGGEPGTQDGTDPSQAGTGEAAAMPSPEGTGGAAAMPTGEAGAPGAAMPSGEQEPAAMPKDDSAPAAMPSGD